MGAHVPLLGGELTARQRLANIAMRCVRQSIEWSFGLTSGLFQICNNFNLVKLNTEEPYAVEQLRCTYLLTNFYTCLNQNVVSAWITFGCRAPALEEYWIP